MAKTASAPAITRLKLLKPHTHARREYPAGGELDVVALGITQEDAGWLIGIEVATDISNGDIQAAPPSTETIAG